MDVIIVILYLIYAVLGIAMIVKFFQIAKDVRNIQEKMNDKVHDIPVTSIISARLIGNAEEVYNQLVKDTVNFLESFHQMDTAYMQTETLEKIQKQISKYQRRAKALGRELPKELKSLQTYREFRKTLTHPTAQ